jgi:hypothetical protein
MRYIMAQLRERDGVSWRRAGHHSEVLVMSELTAADMTGFLRRFPMD